MKLTTKNIVIMALLITISVGLLYLIRYPIFLVAPYLEYDPADIPILSALSRSALLPVSS